MLTNAYTELNSSHGILELYKRFHPEKREYPTKMLPTKDTSGRLNYKFLALFGGIFCFYFYILSVISQHCFKFLLTTFLRNDVMFSECNQVYHFLHFLLAHCLIIVSGIIYRKISSFADHLLTKVCDVFAKSTFLRLPLISQPRYRNIRYYLRKFKNIKETHTFWKVDKAQDKIALICKSSDAHFQKKNKNTSCLQSRFRKITQDCDAKRHKFCEFNKKTVNIWTLRNTQVVVFTNVYSIEVIKAQNDDRQELIASGPSDKPKPAYNNASVKEQQTNKLKRVKHIKNRIGKQTTKERHFFSKVKVRLSRIDWQKYWVDFIQNIQISKIPSEEKRKHKWKKRYKGSRVFNIVRERHTYLKQSEEADDESEWFREQYATLIGLILDPVPLEYYNVAQLKWQAMTKAESVQELSWEDCSGPKFCTSLSSSACASNCTSEGDTLLLPKNVAAKLLDIAALKVLAIKYMPARWVRREGAPGLANSLLPTSPHQNYKVLRNQESIMGSRKEFEKTGNWLTQHIDCEISGVYKDVNMVRDIYGNQLQIVHFAHQPSMTFTTCDMDTQNMFYIPLVKERICKVKKGIDSALNDLKEKLKTWSSQVEVISGKVVSSTKCCESCLNTLTLNHDTDTSKTEEADIGTYHEKLIETEINKYISKELPAKESKCCPGLPNQLDTSMSSNRSILDWFRMLIPVPDVIASTSDANCHYKCDSFNKLKILSDEKTDTKAITTANKEDNIINNRNKSVESIESVQATTDTAADTAEASNHTIKNSIADEDKTTPNNLGGVPKTASERYSFTKFVVKTISGSLAGIISKAMCHADCNTNKSAKTTNAELDAAKTTSNTESNINESAHTLSADVINANTTIKTANTTLEEFARTNKTTFSTDVNTIERVKTSLDVKIGTAKTVCITTENTKTTLDAATGTLKHTTDNPISVAEMSKIMLIAAVTANITSNTIESAKTTLDTAVGTSKYTFDTETTAEVPKIAPVAAVATKTASYTIESAKTRQETAVGTSNHTIDTESNTAEITKIAPIAESIKRSTSYTTNIVRILSDAIGIKKISYQTDCDTMTIAYNVSDAAVNTRDNSTIKTDYKTQCNIKSISDKHLLHSSTEESTNNTDGNDNTKTIIVVERDINKTTNRIIKSNKNAPDEVAAVASYTEKETVTVAAKTKSNTDNDSTENITVSIIETGISNTTKYSNTQNIAKIISCAIASIAKTIYNSDFNTVINGKTSCHTDNNTMTNSYTTCDAEADTRKTTENGENFKYKAHTIKSNTAIHPRKNNSTALNANTRNISKTDNSIIINTKNISLTISDVRIAKPTCHLGCNTSKNARTASAMKADTAKLTAVECRCDGNIQCKDHHANADYEKTTNYSNIQESVKSTYRVEADRENENETFNSAKSKDIARVYYHFRLKTSTGVDSETTTDNIFIKSTSV